MDNNRLPHKTQPCKDCPFRKDAPKGWLGEERMAEILNQRSFTCHKTNQNMQCAGHMLMNDYGNDFVRMAKAMGITLDLTGHELVFDNHEDCIAHHGED